MKYEKVFIIGIPGSGKSFLADLLSERLGLDKIDLDDIYWKQKYSQKRSEVEAQKVLNQKVKDKGRWICEGIYDSWTKKAMEDADIITWLDLDKNLLSWRIFNRWLKRRKKTGEDIKEVLSLIKFQRSYRKVRKGKEISFYDSHKRSLKKYSEKVVLIKSRKELKEFLSGLK